MINYFNTIKAALDASFAVICAHKGIPRDQGPALVRDELKKMNAEWFKTLPANVNYADPMCRFAYLFSHTAANANLCEIAIRESPDVVALIKNRAETVGKLKVCAFGGGPGTELLAIAKHLLKTRPNGPHLQVKFDLLDRVDEWIESWKALEGEITRILDANYGSFVKHPFSAACTIYGKDMTAPHQYVNLPTLFDQDIFFLNYVVSEISGDSVDITKDATAFVELISHAAKTCKSGSKFVIADRDQNNVVANAQKLLAAAGLTPSAVTKVCRRMDADEKFEVLKDYSGDIERYPRVWWKGRFGADTKRGAFYIIGTKP
jgi:hypothetical protein